MSRVPLRLRYAALRTLLWQRYEAIPRVSSLDLENWQVCGVDPDAPHTPRTDLATGVGPTLDDAVDALLQALAADDAAPCLRTDDGPVTLAALAHEYPRGFTWTPAATGDDTVDGEAMPRAVGGAR